MASERPSKRVKLLAEDSDSDGDSSGTGGVEVSNSSGFKVNEEFARRFEHNQKRAERHRLEEKYGKEEDSDDDDSTDEEEDDDAVLASGALDEQFAATLKALKKKDPSIYKKDIKFYDDEEDEEEGGDKTTEKKEKPMYLRDYHKQNLLSGKTGAEDEDDEQPKTFAQEQEAIRRSVVNAMHADEEADSDEEMEDGDDGFLVKRKVELPDLEPTKKADKVSAKDDPDAFLDDFLSRRAWVPTDRSNQHAFESDDEDFDRDAEDFEQAYNMRFEDPDANKGKLISHARDIAAKYSVRQETGTKRARGRETEKEKKAAMKAERDAGKARLKKLKIEEAEEKLRKIKETAGLKGREFDMDEWSHLLTGDWDDAQWEKEFEKQFDDKYYEELDGRDSEEDGKAADGKKKKPKKPKFDDDIDITDLIPDFENDEEAQFSITDDEADLENGDAEQDDDDQATSKKPKKSRDHKKAKEEAKRESRRERRKLEALVDTQLESDLPFNNIGGSRGKGKAAVPSTFRYRETSPTAYGISATEILMASDAQLNSLVGLKKLATWREPDKKRKDKKRLGKKARIRAWKKETFGNEEGPGEVKSLQDVMATEK